MNNRRTVSFSILAAALLALALPGLAVAQRYPDYGRYPDQGRYDNYQLRESIRRLDSLSKDFQRDLDRSLDRSRRDGTRNEDDINRIARDFRRSVSDLRSSFGNGRDLNRSRDEAQRVLQIADHVDRNTRSRWFDSRLASEWLEIRRELNVIERAYGLQGYGRNGRRDPWWQQIPLPW